MHEYAEKFGFDASRLQSRREYFRITDGDLETLAGLRSMMVEHTAGVVEGFYDHLLDYPATRSYLSDTALVQRLKRKQSDYFLELFTGRIDLDYVDGRLKIGTIHERLGVPPWWYIGAYNLYVELIGDLLARELPAEDVHPAHTAIRKIVDFDAALALDAYVWSHVETTRRHQAAIRELSTPVIQVYEQVLLMPIVGTVDSRRAQQIMESVLQGVTDHRARVLLLDIAGVPVVDTQVADHLLKTTAAVRLLGASTILTGISAQVARTMVELGVDVSAMQTRSRLKDGLELALSMVGKRIGEV
ncbi:MAG: rsbT co-antagonist protein RsbR [Myxococcota bacterium]